MIKKYDSYKDSGVEWIGKIPSHWDITKHKFHLNILSGFPFKSELFSNESGFPLIRIRDITSGNIETFYQGEYSNEYIVKRGDLVIGMDGDFNIRNWDNQDGLLNQRCCSVRETNKVIQRWLFYILPNELKIINDLTYYTTVKHLSNSDIYNTNTILPPLHEQQQIVSFLDNKTLLIDALIEKTQRKIELLKEQRTSLINHTVTKGLPAEELKKAGLNPNVEMKDSGVEWIGEIPIHWENRNGSTLGLYSKGKGIKKDEVKESGNPCIRYGEIYTKYNHIVKDVTTFIDDKTTSTSISINGVYLLLTGSGETKEEIGKCIVYTCSDTIWVGGDIILIKPNKDIYSVFLSYLINSECIRVQREMFGKGEIIVHIYPKNFKEMRYPIPPYSEQQQIVEYLDEQTQIIDTTITKEEKRIELLKEYRQSLISNVVTGKIKVTTDD